METSNNNQDDGGPWSHCAYLEMKCCSIQDQIRASLNDMELEHPGFEIASKVTYAKSMGS